MDKPQAAVATHRHLARVREAEVGQGHRLVRGSAVQDHKPRPPMFADQHVQRGDAVAGRHHEKGTGRKRSARQRNSADEEWWLVSRCGPGLNTEHRERGSKGEER
jgi:hypothetical protein